MERGLGHGQVYKTEFVDLKIKRKGRGTSEVRFEKRSDFETFNLFICTLFLIEFENRQ